MATNYWAEFVYVDGYYTHPSSGRPMKWVRMQPKHLGERIVQRADGRNCFRSVQFFRDATSDLEGTQVSEEKPPVTNGKDAEELAAEARMREATMLPDKQVHYHGLYFDFDAPKGLSQLEAIDASLADVKELARFFTTAFEDIEPCAFQTYFSGKKGFHVELRPEVFGIRPHRHLTYTVKNVAMDLADRFGLKTLDLSVYTVPRMWRLVNTEHPKSGHYKVELRLDEVFRMSADDIWKLSSQPRVENGLRIAWAPSFIWDLDEYRNLSPDPDALSFWANYVSHYEAYRDLQALKPRKAIQVPRNHDGEAPVCVADILNNGPKTGGPNRNRVILPLAGFLHDSGSSEQDAVNLIDDFTRSYYGDERDRIANGRSVVRSAYHGNLRFACRFIRSVAGPGEAGRVACVGEEACPWVGNPQDQEPAELPLLPLSEASKGCYIGTQVRTAVHVAAVAGLPFEIPLSGEVRCTPKMDAAVCQSCPNNSEPGHGNGRLNFQFTAQDREILALINVPDPLRRAAMRAFCGIPSKCKKHTIEVETYGNMEEVQLIPMVDFADAYRAGEAVDGDDDNKQLAARHVVRLGYFLGHGIIPNKKYVIEASVFGHPRDQRVVFVFDKADAAQNDIDQFKMTPELYRKLLVFRPRQGQMVEDKLNEIQQDFVVNVHQIGGRSNLGIMVDLAYHSIIGFNFVGQFVHKGWFELLIIGDTASGKALTVDTPMPTPSGTRKMGDLKVGDLVWGSDGNPTEVLGVFPQGREAVVKVTFSDGQEVRCSRNHLWTVYNQNMLVETYGPITLSVEDLLKRGYKNRAGAKYWVPPSPVVRYADDAEPSKLQRFAYLLGAIVVCGDLSAPPYWMNSPPRKVLKRISSELGDGAITRRSWSMYPNRHAVTMVEFSEVVAELGAKGWRSSELRVPDAVFTAPASVREAFWEGMVDAGLTRREFTGQVPKGVRESAMQLGRSIGKSVHVTIDGFVKERTKYKRQRIISIEPDGEDECVCIQVAAEDGLYLTTGYIVTHNTTLVERTKRHFGLGELIAGEEAKRTGLVYASIQMGKQWLLRWGKLPQNDRRLLVIDEFAAIPKDEIGKMTQLRSEGKARGGGVNADYETWARTRMILLTNPRENTRSIGEFNYGVEALDGIFGERQDVRRVDFAMCIDREEVPSSIINKRWDKEEYPHRYTADLCRSLILWAWSREPHHVEWVGNAEQQVLDYANDLGERLECDIPLAERADLRLKVARVAVAVAARVFSTDSDAKKVLVTEEHVNVAAAKFESAYCGATMGYSSYARKYKNDNDFTHKRRSDVLEYFQMLGKSAGEQVVSALLDVDIITKGVFRDMVNLEMDEFNKLWKFIVGDRLIQKIPRGYKKTPAFTKLLRGMRAKGTGYEDPETEYERARVGAIEAERELLLAEDMGEEPPF